MTISTDSSWLGKKMPVLLSACRTWVKKKKKKLSNLEIYIPAARCRWMVSTGPLMEVVFSHQKASQVIVSFANLKVGRVTFIQPTSLRKNTSRVFLFRLHLRPFSRRPSRGESGSSPAPSQSERRSAEGGGACPVGSRKKYKIPGCRINAFLHNNTCPSRRHGGQERQDDRPDEAVEGESRLSGGWVSALSAAAPSRLDYLGEGSWKVQKGDFSPTMSGFSADPYPATMYMLSPLQPHCHLRALMS